MNCKNCTCPECTTDRTRTDLKAHRLKVLEIWNWNLSVREAARSLKREIEAGRGGSLEAWILEINAFLPSKQAGEVRDYYNKIK